jgi:Xaa-Pro aminopeptidase
LTIDHAARLSALRAELNARSLEGFFVPLVDEHNSEYVAGYAQRLEWLTGFRGSQGMAIVLADRAAIFVDGRYVIQVKDQVDGTLFERIHSADQTRWTGWNLPSARATPSVMTPDCTRRAGWKTRVPSF